MRCFEIGLNANSPDWRDSSFVVCTSDTQLIQEVLAELTLPPAQRSKHVNGRILHGDAGYNRNGSHTFLWHMDPDEWRLAEMSIEVCDGRPYSDVDLDTAYWVGHIEQFCPWSSFIKKEIVVSGVAEKDYSILQHIFPNPAKDEINVLLPEGSGEITIWDPSGRMVLHEEFKMVQKSIQKIELSSLAKGLYFLSVKTGNEKWTKKFILR